MLKFWKNFGLFSILFLPISLIYYIIHIVNYHILHRPKRVDAKVICVGNLVVGGSGKTPYAIYLANKLLTHSKNKIAFISRGYQGILSSKQKVHQVKDSDAFSCVGDEALLLARIAPTYICSNRYLAAQQAVHDGANIIIMDDGMQNNTLHKDQTILVFDSHNGFGNGLLLPAGPMREPYLFAKSRVDRVVIIGDGSYDINHRDIKRLSGKIENIAAIKDVIKQSGKACILLTAIANSERVIGLLRSQGVDVMYHKSLPDHSKFDLNILKEMKRRSQSGEVVITTSKDFVRIPREYRQYFVEMQYKLEC